jgi:hypothetical protein
MRVFYTALAATLVLTVGCAHRSVIRDSRVYQAELDQYDNWAVQQAKYLRGFIDEHCECESEAEGPQFSDQECEKAADFVLTIEARHDWHKQMSLWNAGLVEKEPSEQPPEIAPLMCPLPPAPGESDEARIEAEEEAAESREPLPDLTPESEAALPETEEE